MSFVAYRSTTDLELRLPVIALTRVRAGDSMRPNLVTLIAFRMLHLRWRECRKNLRRREKQGKQRGPFSRASGSRLRRRVIR
jgi:hypothetical protein